MSRRIRFPSGATINFVGGTEPLRGSLYDPSLFREGETIYLTDLPGDTMEQREQPHPMQSTAQIAPSTPIDTIENDQALREAFATIYDLCAQIIPEGRYKSLVMTGLEIAQMWAIKAIHHTPR